VPLIPLRFHIYYSIINLNKTYIVVIHIDIGTIPINTKAILVNNGTMLMSNGALLLNNGVM
jgi:hypothetical protein